MIKLKAPALTGSHLIHDRRGVVAMWVAVTTPVVAMALGLGVDVTEWVIANQQLQRAADAAATAGSIKYGLLSSNAQQAAGIAADVAEANGIVGASSRTWTAATKTLLDNNITVVVGNPLTAGNNASVGVTVTKTVAPTFAKVFSSASKTITATATADSTGGGSASTYQQPCLFAVGTAVAGANELMFTTSVTFTGCSVQSNQAIFVTSGNTLTAGTIYAANTLSATGATVVGTKLINTGTQIADPYTSNTTLNTAFGQLASTANKSAVSALVGSTATTLTAGIYPSITVGGTYTGTITLQPGLYVVKGTISLGGSATILGSAVTLVNNGSISFIGSVKSTLTAPTVANAVSSAVPGVLLANNLASTLSATGQVLNTASVLLAGILYFPSSNVNFANTVTVNSGSSCLEIIANQITIANAVSLINTGCSALGASTIGPASTATVGGGKLSI